jgi:hypothetical protein
MGQLQDFYMKLRIEGFTYKGKTFPPITEAEARAQWEANKTKYFNALQRPQLRARLGLDALTPTTDNPITGVLSAADIVTLTEELG